MMKNNPHAYGADDIARFPATNRPQHAFGVDDALIPGSVPSPVPGVGHLT
jgi:hypothetical protein